MLAIYVILLAAVPYSAYGQENPYKCHRLKNKKCGRDGMPRNFPDTISTLQDACSGMSQYLSCYLNVREECHPLGNITRNIRELYEYAQSVCEEDSSTYRVVSKNLQCLANSVERIESLCYEMPIEGKLQFFNETVGSHVGDMDSLTGRDKYCLNTIMTITCGSLVAGTRCGDEVEDIVFDASDKYNGQFLPCTTEMSALKGTLRAAFRAAFKEQESFMKRIGHYNGTVIADDAVEQESF